MNLLIADDEALIREGLLSMDWKSIGIDEVYSANNGTEVRELLLSAPIDLAIFDIKMPGVSGLELASLIQKQSLDTAVILLTGFSDFAYAQQALRSNVYEYILKPFHPRELLETVAKVKNRLEHKRYQDMIVSQYEKSAGACQDSFHVLELFPNLSRLISDILKDMLANYADQLTLEELADRYHFSVAYLSRRIKAETGYTFLELLKAIRLTNAAHLLLDGERVNQAGPQAGFRDQRYFSQVFRNVFDCSPSTFRQFYPQNMAFHEVLNAVAGKRTDNEDE